MVSILSDQTTAHACEAKMNAGIDPTSNVHLIISLTRVALIVPN